MFLEDFDSREEYEFFNKDEALRKYRNLKQNDAHWLKVNQSAGARKVHVDFVAQAPPSEAAVGGGGARSGSDKATDEPRAWGRRPKGEGRQMSSNKLTPARRGFKIVERKKACALCEQMFPPAALTAEQLRSSIFELRRIFKQIQAESSGGEVAVFQGIGGADGGAGDKVRVRVEDRGPAQRPDKFKFSGLYDKVQVCLFCNQFFPYDTFRKGSRPRRGAKVDNTSSVPASTQRAKTGSLLSIPGVATRAPVVPLPSRKLGMHVWRGRMKAKREDAAKQRAIRELRALDKILNIMERSLNGRAVRGGISKRLQAFLDSTSYHDGDAASWIPCGTNAFELATTNLKQSAGEGGPGGPETSTRGTLRARRKEESMKSAPRFLVKSNLAEEAARVARAGAVGDGNTGNVDMEEHRRKHQEAMAGVRTAMHDLWASKRKGTNTFRPSMLRSHETGMTTELQTEMRRIDALQGTLTNTCPP